MNVALDVLPFVTVLSSVQTIKYKCLAIRHGCRCRKLYYVVLKDVVNMKALRPGSDAVLFMSRT